MPAPYALVVDDMPDVLAILADAVEMALPAHRVLRACSAEAALSALSDPANLGESPTLLLVDQRLGDSTGLAVVFAARQLGHHPACLLVTGLDDEEVRREAADMRVDLISKPFRLTNLLDAIDRVVRVHQANPQEGSAI
jgi:DNA-binding response OmpR family regulator